MNTLNLAENTRFTDWPNPIHDWLKPQDVAFLVPESQPVLGEFTLGLSNAFKAFGHVVRNSPAPSTAALFTTARFGEPVNWRDAPLFTARRRYGLNATPTIITLIHITPGQLHDLLSHFERVLPKQPPDPADFAFPGLAPSAYRTLFEQGTRGGPIMAVARLLQSQAKSIRIILIVGEQHPEFAYLFDLVGAHPRIHARNPEYFYTDIMLRLTTALSTSEITDHEILPDFLPESRWRNAPSPGFMIRAAGELGKRRFFTEMVQIANLVHVPSISLSVSRQYSEGCFATWDPTINALITTVTGSARPVEKDAISEDDLALITGVKADGSGAIVRQVEGIRNDPPSSESVEMMQMDSELPKIRLSPEWGFSQAVPVVRSKLHGHRGVSAYNPLRVEFTPLEPAYYHYPVSCATSAQANAIVRAFSRAQALQNPEDPRQVVFTVLPGHGLVVVEKWVSGCKPFDHILQLMDKGDLEIDNHIPQHAMQYRPDGSGRMTLKPEH